MAYGNNRTGTQPRASFQLAGGTTIKFRHPYLAGQISEETTNLDEIDISACVKLDGRFFEATPNQESARQVVLIDGSTVTICNRLLNGTLTMPVIRTTGLVASGDFISCLQLIKSVGDTVGGVLYATEFINGKAITRLYYGVTVQSVPDCILEGMDVPVYDVRLLYAGWIEVVGSSVGSNLKKIWASGSTTGIEGYYSPYAIQKGVTEDDTLDADVAAMPSMPNAVIQKSETLDPNAYVSNAEANEELQKSSDYAAIYKAQTGSSS